jgi:hypothetical protein
MHPLRLLPLLISIPAFSQSRPTIHGSIRDNSSGEALIGAAITIIEQPGTGTVSNAYGFFSLTLSIPRNIPAATTIVASFIGYQPDTLHVALQSDTLIDIRLDPGDPQLQTAVVSALKKGANITNPIMGVQKLSINEIKNVPVLFGEKDILKTIQLLPGIKSAGDGNSGFYVRGGASDQNLILLDEATVYNPDHLLGFFSTFNSDAIKDVTVYKGGMPSDYGGRLSSVVDIKMNDGSDQRFSGSGGIGLIASHLNFEGPIKKDEGSFTISGRRTYADLFLHLSKDTNINKDQLYFYDINAKANYKLSANDRLYLSGYFGKDKLGVSDVFGLQYGNTTATIRWNHTFNSRLFSNTSLIYSNYNYGINLNNTTSAINLTSTIRDFSLKEDLQYYIDQKNTLHLGLQTTQHTLIPGVLDATQSSSFNSVSLPKKYDLESATYFSHEWSPISALHVNYGLRLTDFTIFGPGTFYNYDKAGNATDSTTWSAGHIVKTYFNPEPRLSASYRLHASSSIKVAYTRNVQNLHLLSNSTSNNPTDLWIPSSNNVKPEIADQVSLGYFKNLDNNQYELSAEAYYKAMQNQIDYKNGAQLRANANVEADLLFGKGQAYGLELFGKKKTGPVTGWISYTLSRTQLKIDGINNDSWYPARQDITHDISIVGIWQPSKKWTLSATWVYNTGSAVTFPNGKYEVDGQIAYYYTQRNAYRMPAYHRLDLAATIVTKKTAHKENSWTFSVYNAYDRSNPYSIQFQQDPTDASRTQAVQYTLFKIVPSVTYNYKF